MSGGIQLSAAMLNTEAVSQLLRDMAGPKARAAYVAALNDTGFHVRKVWQEEMRSKFDRVTPYIERSPRVVRATPDNLTVTIEPAYMGGKGVDPQKILQAQTHGGPRRDKRSESALRRVGLLPAGYQTAIPKTPYPGSDDGRGNLRGPFLVQLISYFQAFGEQGYRANMTDKRKKKLRNQQDIGYVTTRKTYKTTLGVRFFISMGRLRDTQASHLAPGIWAAKGLHDVEVQPVLMFVKAGSYQPRLSPDDVTKAADVQNYLDRRVRYRVRQAAGV
ncbi:hypothetical protein [Alicycliphilus denitrificans]|uniref:hypothetical protein n=1 Tax=Alicycliphilus denitrificans TaxID=179636 RepID=UPI0001DA0DE3|nr:hypothetical protein [Alicycliphilus denitrificans]ADV01280.1 hypothetical protein Alide_3562 [Alicycliphilus denitrificans BC]